MNSALYFAIESQNFILAKKVLESQDVDPNAIIPDTGISSMHLAVGLSKIPNATTFLELLLRHGGDPNCRSVDGATPVHVAAAWEKLDELNILLTYGGDATIKDCEGQTALDYAMKEGNKEVIMKLKSYKERIYPDLENIDTPNYTLELERVEICNECISSDLSRPDKLTEFLEHMHLENEAKSDELSVEKDLDRVSQWCKRHYFSADAHSIKTPLAGNDAASVVLSADEYQTCASHISSVRSSVVSEIYKYHDESKNITLFEKRMTPPGEMGNIESSRKPFMEDSEVDDVQSSGSSLTSIDSDVDFDTETLRRELTAHGHAPGPITNSTKKVYIRRLLRLRRNEAIEPTLPADPGRPKFSRELEKSIRAYSSFDHQAAVHLENLMMTEFTTSLQGTRKWREGHSKSSFTYLLLDPRKSQNLPARHSSLEPSEVWLNFLTSIFYVGKGSRSRPYSHLYEAVGVWSGKSEKRRSNKVSRILDIWQDKVGVVCLHIFQSVIPVEAYTREAAMIEAIGLQNLSNAKSGEYYGKVGTKSPEVRRLLGVHLLHKAMHIFLHEGERQLLPADVV